MVQLGAGGAGTATAYAALKLGARHIGIIDIDAARGASLADRLNTLFGAGRATATSVAALERADGLIHDTPVGMHGHPGSPLPLHLLRGDLWVAEVVYFPIETELLREARRLGCRTMDGGGMAVEQAVEAFRLFTALAPDAARTHRHFAELLTAKAGTRPGPSSPAV